MSVFLKLNALWQARPKAFGGNAVGAKSPAGLSQRYGAQSQGVPPALDVVILYTTAILLFIGVVMVYSASIGLPEAKIFSKYSSTHFLVRQLMFIGVASVIAAAAFTVPMNVWQKHTFTLFIVCLIALIVVVTEFGKISNNARRWIAIGTFTVQPSEFMKLAIIFFTASYCVRKKLLLENFTQGFLPILVAISAVSAALYLEPDLGALVVISVVCIGIFFVGGSAIKPILLLGTMVAVLSVAIIMTSQRLQRVEAFLDPFSPAIAQREGYQLGNSLIAFSRGEVFGQGLGNSVEKMNHLTEAHTDFILAILAEELGFIGVMSVIGLFALLIFRAFMVGRKAMENNLMFNGLVAHGIALWMGLQVGIHLCVNTGAMPTKGITLPFISYGGSSILMAMVAVAVLLRVDYETRLTLRGQIVGKAK